MILRNARDVLLFSVHLVVLGLKSFGCSPGIHTWVCVRMCTMGQYALGALAGNEVCHDDSQERSFG